jgi:polysaccharide deacetylase family protein (PEP-CTERM system associated)
MNSDLVPVKRHADGRVINAMSVDVEEYFQVGAFETCIARDSWADIASRVDYNTNIVLDLLAEKQTHATFFTLGWVAERSPALIQRIIREGHEIASHGYAHDRITSLTADSFRTDLQRTKTILEDAAGVQVIGYRAPSFSIGKKNLWALDVLAELGYAYSSSVYPIAHDHYGWPEAPRWAFKPVAGSPMVEIPVTTVKVLGKTRAAGGGGFFRFFPYPMSRWALAQVNETEGHAGIFYFHPWEVDAEQPVQKQASFKSRLRHYVNLSKMRGKVAHVLDDFHWDRVDRVFLGSPAAQSAAA